MNLALTGQMPVRFGILPPILPPFIRSPGMSYEAYQKYMDTQRATAAQPAAGLGKKVEVIWTIAKYTVGLPFVILNKLFEHKSRAPLIGPPR